MDLCFSEIRKHSNSGSHSTHYVHLTFSFDQLLRMQSRCIHDNNARQLLTTFIQAYHQSALSLTEAAGCYTPPQLRCARSLQSSNLRRATKSYWQLHQRRPFSSTHGRTKNIAETTKSEDRASEKLIADAIKVAKSLEESDGVRSDPSIIDSSRKSPREHLDGDQRDDIGDSRVEKTAPKTVKSRKSKRLSTKAEKGSNSGGKQESTLEKDITHIEGKTASTEVRQTRKAPAWLLYKQALKEKFPEGWNPRKKISPDAMEGMKALHAQYPEECNRKVLAAHFKISQEAVRRILKSPKKTDFEEARRRQAWAKRYDRIWDSMSQIGLRPKRQRNRSPDENTFIAPAMNRNA